MTETEHLLVCIMEEAAEVQQAAAKCLRFGLEHGYEDRETTNAEDLAFELDDLEGIRLMLINRKVISTGNMKHQSMKITRALEHIELAKELGTITDAG